MNKQKEQPPTRGVDLKSSRKPPLVKVFGVVFLCKNLLTNQNDERKQCQKKHSKRHKVCCGQVIVGNFA